MTRLRLAVLTALCILLATLPAVAQADPDPPSRVARLNYITGDVSFQPGGVDDWTAAELNRPLTTADRLWTDRGSRAELHVGSAALRLGPETSFSLANLDDHRVQIQIAQGKLNLRVRALAEDDSFEVDTPNLTFILLHPGDYRVDVDSEGQTSFVTVRSGSGELAIDSQRLTVRTGQQARFSSGERAVGEINDAPARDEFDQWCVSRTRREDDVISARYISPEITGYEDLDMHGDWREEAGYGWVWAPRQVVADWAPYRYGHWAWVFPWGWTWIDDSPWGFAPFHYGRWVHLRRGWGWVPGPRVARPVYAPALVAWIGGNGWAVGVSTGRPVGWFPLGPREVYVPAYRASHTYVTNVNITNTNVKIVNINNTTISRVHVNQHVRGAVTAVPEDAFINSRPVHRAVINIREERLQRVKIVAAAPATPAPASVLGREGAPGRRPPERVLVRPVVSRNAPPRPVPFEVQRRSIANDGTIHSVHPQDFPEMRRPQTVSPDKPGAPANAGRGRDMMPPERRADADRADPPSDRGRSNADAEPSARPTFRDVPRPDRDRAAPRAYSEGVNQKEHGKPDRADDAVPRPPEQNADRTAEPPRDVPRAREERVSEQPRASEPREIAPPAEHNPVPRAPEPAVRDVPRPAQERVSDEPKPNAPRPTAPAAQPSSGSRAPESVGLGRDVPRPNQDRTPERPAPSSPRSVTPPPQPNPSPRASEAVREVRRPQQGSDPRVEQPQPRQTGNSRPTNTAERPSSRPSHNEKAAPQKQDDKSKSKPDKGDRS